MGRCPTGSSSWPGSTRRRPTRWRKRLRMRPPGRSDRIAGYRSGRGRAEPGAERPRAARRLLARSDQQTPRSFAGEARRVGRGGLERSEERRVGKGGGGGGGGGGCKERGHI